MLNHDELFGPEDIPSHQVPPKLLANEFGEVSIRNVRGEVQVAAALAMGAFVIGDGESCHVGLALDGSASMKFHYGQSKRIPRKVAKDYINKGMYKLVERDGVTHKMLTPEAEQDVLRKGLVESSPNVVREPTLRLLDNMIRTFAPGGAQSGTCEVIYWACNANGKGVESVGQLRLSELDSLEVDGPREQPFGEETFLAPALRHFLDRAGDGNGIFVFLTDGRIADEDAVIQLTHRMAQKMADANVYPPNVRCVLAGVGKEVDQEQLSRIDDMAMPEGLTNYDIWNSKVLTEIRDISDLWSEIFDPTTTIATRAVVYDDQGSVIKEWTDNVTALITFTLPASSQSFELEIKSENPNEEGFRIFQDLRAV